MPTPPKTRDAITRLLQEIGPMTANELAIQLSMKVRTVQSCISTSRATPERHFYVIGYERQVGRRGLWAQIYQAGNKRDARTPVIDRSVTDARYREKKEAAQRLARHPGFEKGNPFAVAMLQVMGSGA